MSGIYTLRQIAELAAGETHIEVTCRRCPRHGRLSIAKLLSQYGPDKPGPDLLRDLSADCPKRLNPSGAYDLCGVRFPQMSGWVRRTVG